MFKAILINKKSINTQRGLFKVRLIRHLCTHSVLNGENLLFLNQQYNLCLVYNLEFFDFKGTNLKIQVKITFFFI